MQYLAHTGTFSLAQMQSVDCDPWHILLLYEQHIFHEHRPHAVACIAASH